MKAIVWIAFVVLQAEAQAKCENKASNCAEMREQGRCEQVSVFLRLFLVEFIRGLVLIAGKFWVFSLRHFIDRYCMFLGKILARFLCIFQTNFRITFN
jgi:hypothetical protein